MRASSEVARRCRSSRRRSARFSRDGEVGVEVVHLRHDADADARLARRPSAPARRPSSIVPPSGSIRPRQQRSVVVLPAPFGPSRPKHSPRVIVERRGRARLRCRRSACAGRRRAGRRRLRGGRVPPSTRARGVRHHAPPHAGDHALQLRQPAVEEMRAAGKHDDRQLLRPRPVEHLGERHDLVLLAVDDDGVGRHVADREALDGGPDEHQALRRRRVAPRRVCTNDPNENPASTSGSDSPNSRLRMRKRRQRVVGLADAFVERARRLRRRRGN